jgi:uncharacterized protein (TIGR02301 family)
MQIPFLSGRLRVVAFALLFAAMTPAVAGAQPLPTAPPYEKEMHRLAEILGAVHYLRRLCGADEGQTWRSMMQQLIDAETPSPERRAKLVDSFNRGYRGFEQSYRSCTETAVWVIDNYMAEGADIAQRIASRYGQ